MANEETAEEKALKKEGERWKDYASVLLIAMPILMAGITISKEETIFSAIIGVMGFLGIVLIALWYGRDHNINIWTPKGKYPTFLYYASIAFGIQVGVLAIAIISRFFSN